MGFDFEKDNLIVTFDGVLQNTAFVANMRAILKTLQTEMGTPVDVEFAHDGTDLYLVQCRAQAFGRALAARRNPPRRRPREDRLLRLAARDQRRRFRHHPRRVRRPGTYSSPAGSRRPPGRRAGGQRAEPDPPETPLHPDGARPLGEPRRHQAGGERHLLRHQQHGDADRDRQETGRVHARAVVRHALLPGPRGIVDQVPAALPGRPRRGVQREVLPREPQFLPVALAEIRAPGRHHLRHRHPAIVRRAGAQGADERRARRGRRDADRAVRDAGRRDGEVRTGGRPAARTKTTTGAGGPGSRNGSRWPSTPTVSA